MQTLKPVSASIPHHEKRGEHMPDRQPTNRLGAYSPQWLALLVEMRLMTAKQASKAHKRAVKDAPPLATRRDRRKPE